VTATFNESVQSLSITFVLKDSGGNLVAAGVAYNDVTHTVTLTPAAPLSLSTTYTVTVSGATDSGGNVMAAPLGWSFTTGSQAWTQTAVADFSAGTQSNTTVLNTAGGEERLGQTFDDFTGTSLSSKWTTTILVSGSSSTVANSIVSVKGREIRSATVPVGTPIEGKVAFGSSVNEYFGLATDVSTTVGNYWAVFSTRSSTNTLFARVNINGTSHDVSLGGLPSGFHDYLVQSVSGGYQFYVDGALKTTIAFAIPTGTALKAVLSNTSTTVALQADWVRYGAYVSSGTFVSSVFDAGRLARWGKMSWTATLPAGTTMTVLTRSGNTATPDGSWSAWSSVSNGGTIASPAARYIQYEIVFTTTSSILTPTLSNISLTWN
jgi:hypothetical protein